MRIVSILPLAGLALLLAVPAAQAQDKGRSSFGGVWTAAHAPISLRGSYGVASAEPVDAPTPDLPQASFPEAKPVIREAAASGSWCAKGRLVGSGTGFCEIN